MQVQTVLPEPRMTPREPEIRCEFCEIPLHPEDYRTWKDFAVCDECYEERRNEEIQQMDLQKFMDLLEEEVNPYAKSWEFEDGELFLRMVTKFRNNAKAGEKLLRIRDVSGSWTGRTYTGRNYDGGYYLVIRVRPGNYRFDID